MKKCFLSPAIAALALFVCPLVKADLTVTFSTPPASLILQSDGVFLLSGSLVRIGYFDLSGSTLTTLQTSNDFTTINSLFRPLAEGISGAGTVTQLGNSGNALMINDMFSVGQAFGQIDGITAGYIPEGQFLSAWVFNGPNASSSNQWGIYSSSTAWAVPPDMGSVVLSTSDINTVVRGSQDVSGNYHLATIPAAVPEPSGLLLIAITGVLIITKRSKLKRTQAIALEASRP
jgi:hypothetical protein